MKKIISVICILFLVVSCQKNVDHTPVYKDFKNQLEELNIYGNVKEIVKKKAYPIAGFDYKYGDLKMNATYIFNKEGNYEKTETYNEFDQLETSGEYFYNAQNLLEEFKMISFNGNESKLYNEINKFNADSLLSYKKVMYEGSPEYEFFMKYDTNGNTIETIEIQEKDTSIVSARNIYDEENRMIKTTGIQSNPYEMYSQSYTYDTTGNLILHKAEFKGLKIKNEHIYRDAILFKSKQHRILSDKEEVLERIIEYDHYYNPVMQTEFEDTRKTKILKKKYKFDSQGNWTKRTTYINNNPSKSDTFEPYLMETREITYW